MCVCVWLNDAKEHTGAHVSLCNLVVELLANIQKMLRSEKRGREREKAREKGTEREEARGKEAE
jgi:hypothetical protein